VNAPATAKSVDIIILPTPEMQIKISRRWNSEKPETQNRD
jgi:hypothetical protein